MNGAWAAAAALAAALGSLAACGGEPPEPAADAAARFDRRLERPRFVEWETGAPAALAAAEGGAVELLPGADPTAWTVRAGDAAADAEGRWRVAAQGAAELVLEGLDLPLDPAERLRLELSAAGAGALVVELEVERGAGPQAVVLGRALTEADPRTQAGGLTVDESFEGGGRLRAVRLRAPAGTCFDRLSLVPLRTPDGVSPRVEDGLPVDAGLEVLQVDGTAPADTDREGRRALPARAGRWQVAEYEAGGDAVLFTGVALPSTPLERAGPVRFAVHARPASSAPPPEGARLLFEAVLDPARDADRWRTVRVELPGEVGESWELLLVAEDDGRAGRAIGSFAAPVLVRRAVPRPPDLVLITADTLRADHVGATRRALGLEPLPGLATPFLDGLAARGTNFVDALATSNATCPSHASILTGHYPRDHRVTDNRRTLAEGALTLAERLRDQYYCVSSVTAVHLNATVSGLGQGFDLTLEVPQLDPRRLGQTRVDPLDRERLPERYDDYQALREAPYANARLARVLAEAGELPLFLWLHYFDPHTPYRVTAGIAPLLPPTREGGTTLIEAVVRHLSEVGGDPRPPAEIEAELLATKPLLRASADQPVEATRVLYAAGVSELDRDLATLFEALDRRAAERVVLFTADHGESLGERGIWFDHRGVYGNTLAVPLIVAGDGFEAGAVSRAPVSTLDVLPTLVALAGLELPAELPGRPLAAPAPADERRRWFQHSDDLEVGYREGAEHVVLTLRDHVQSLSGTPRRAGELERLVGGEAAVAGDGLRERLAQEVLAWARAPVLDLEAIEAELDARQRAELRALGYTDE